MAPLFLGCTSIFNLQTGPGKLGLSSGELEMRLSQLLKVQSERAGVSMRYLLSSSFAELARQRTGKENPSFIEMKDAFWLAPDPIGQEISCPRDGRPGCALVDFIPRCERREQTHFMSWTWRYTLAEVSSALDMFQASFVSGVMAMIVLEHFDPLGTFLENPNIAPLACTSWFIPG